MKAESLEQQVVQLQARVRELEHELQQRTNDSSFLASLLSVVPAIIIRADADLRIRYVSRYMAPTSEETVIGEPMAAFVVPEDAPDVEKVLRQVLETGVPGSYVSRSWVQDSIHKAWVARVDDENGMGLCCVAVDITDERKQADAFRVSQEQLELAVEAAGLGLWEWDIRTDAVLWNDRMRAICGRDVPTSFRAFVEELVHPEDIESCERVGRRIFEDLVCDTNIHRIIRPDGRVRWVLSCGKLFVEDGRPVRLVGGTLDVTEQQTLEEQLRQAQRMQSLGMLTAGVAHNFNNMLAVMLPALEAMRRQAAPQSVAMMLANDALSAGNQAVSLVRQLMTVGRQRGSQARAEVRVDELVVGVLRLCGHSIDPEVTITTHFTDDLPTIQCNESDLGQVFVNLIFNARDALQDPGADHARTRPSKIDVTVDTEWLNVSSETRPAGQYVRVLVSDNGAGMTADVRRRVFEPFFTTKDVGQGTGLGLSTAHVIVRDHGGFIDVESTRGVGTTFTVCIPVSSPREAPLAKGG